MFGWWRKIVLILSVLNLSGCGGYYASDVYFGPEKSDGWVTQWDNNRKSTFQCSGHTVAFLSSVVSSQKTSEGLFGVPVLPASKIIKQENKEEKLKFMLEYRETPPAICSAEDVLIRSPHRNPEIKPVTAAMDYRETDRHYYCMYQFDMAQATVNEFTLQVLSGKLGCTSPPLKIKRTSNSQYNFSPW